MIHDFDYEQYPSLADHVWRGMELLRRRGWPEPVVRAVGAHASYTGIAPEAPVERAIVAADELSGFVGACALVRPSRSVRDLPPESVVKKMKDKAFARAVSREDIIKGAAELGVDLDEHIAFCIEAMKPIANELGLDGSAARSA